MIQKWVAVPVEEPVEAEDALVEAVASW